MLFRAVVCFRKFNICFFSRKVELQNSYLYCIFLFSFLVKTQLVECPSIYEMMANPTFKWKTQPQIQVWRKQSNDGKTSVRLESFGPDESIIFFEEALRNNEVPFSDPK